MYSTTDDSKNLVDLISFLTSCVRPQIIRKMYSVSLLYIIAWRLQNIRKMYSATDDVTEHVFDPKRSVPKSIRPQMLRTMYSTLDDLYQHVFDPT